MADGSVPLARAGIGQSPVRQEDLRFLTGCGRYGDDRNLLGQLIAYVLRSPHAHAEIVTIDMRHAVTVPGVVAVLTGEDYLSDGLRPMPHAPKSTSPPDITLVNSDGAEIEAPAQLPLAVARVRFVGEPVALVVAETLACAKDAAELIAVEYHALPAVVGAVTAAERGAPRVWDKPNVVVDAMVGDGEATATAFARAAHIARLDTHVQRVTGVPMEARTALAEYDPHARPICALRPRRRGRPAQARRRPYARHRRGAGSRHRRGCRRQFRHPQLLLSRVRAGLLGGEAHSAGR